MNKTKIGIFFTLLLVLGVCSSCGEKRSNNKLLLNEVPVSYTHLTLPTTERV